MAGEIFISLTQTGEDRAAELDQALAEAFASGAKSVVVSIANDDSDFVSLARARGGEFLPIQCGLAEVTFRNPAK